jgi:hypothetical protein
VLRDALRKAGRVNQESNKKSSDKGRK